jgi:2-methylisocitrate lyase-like PEP mutase family enzyme
MTARARAQAFRRLHEPGALLLLPNAWDAGSARLVESCGATAIATTSAGLAWSHGYPDGNALPPDVVVSAVTEIARVISLPLTADVEGGYSDDPHAVGDTVAAVAAAGAVGINIEDGSEPPELLSAKIAAVRAATGPDLFVNARTDVYLKGLVPPARAVAETIERGRRYRAAGCDGLFVPGVRDAAEIRAIVEAIDLPINVLVVPGLPKVAELRTLGVRRLSAGSGLAAAAYAVARTTAARFLGEGLYDPLLQTTLDYAQMNALLSGR